MTTFCLFFTLILNKFLLRTKNYLLKNSCLYSFAKVKALAIIEVTLLNYLCVNSKKTATIIVTVLSLYQLGIIPNVRKRSLDDEEELRF